MKLLKSKKADLKFILRAALVVFLLVILTSITLNGLNRWRDSTEDCIGTCRTSCNVGEVRYSSTCIRDGDEVYGLVCCTGGMTGEEDEEGPTPPTPPANDEAEEPSEEEPTLPIEETDEETEENLDDEDEIEINLFLGEGDLIKEKQTRLIIEKSYEFKLETTGKGAVGGCEALFINTNTRSRINPTGTFEHIETTDHCQEEFTIKPTEADLDEFYNNEVLFRVRVYDEEEKVLKDKDFNFFIINS